MKQADEFRNRKHYPGTYGGPFEVLIRAGERVDSIPAWAFAILLLVLAGTGSQGEWMRGAVYWQFLLVDWGLIRLLPLASRSFGPAKPQALLLAVLRWPFFFLPGDWSFVVQGLGTALVIYAFWFEPHHPRLVRQKLHSSNLSFGRPLRLLHMGDLHIERFTHREERILQWVEALRADLIVFTGDVLSYSYVEDSEAMGAARRFLGALTAPLGTYAVSGSPPIDGPEVIARLQEGSPIEWLDDRLTQVHFGGDVIDLIGVSCTHKPYEDGDKLKRLLLRSEARFRILLYHSPDLAPVACENGIDLQLSGHTHGGQVRLPFWGALFTSSLYGKRFEAGRYRLGPMTLYVTRGIGMEGKAAPRVRFLCPPEIVLWEICGSPS